MVEHELRSSPLTLPPDNPHSQESLNDNTIKGCDKFSSSSQLTIPILRQFVILIRLTDKTKVTQEYHSDR